MEILYLQCEKVEGGVVWKAVVFSFSPVLNLAFSDDSISLMNALGLNIVADFFFFFFFHFWNQVKVFQSWGKNINC